MLGMLAGNWGVAKIIGNGTNVESSLGFRSSNVADGAAGSWVIGANTNAMSNGAFGIFSANPAANVITALSGGNVGIGTTTPANTLDVAGTVKLGTAGTAMTA